MNETNSSIKSVIDENITIRDIKLGILCYYDKSDERLVEIITKDTS